jgi:anti-sigma regulatory factor (Ser/Thr protein kinase)
VPQPHGAPCEERCQQPAPAGRMPRVRNDALSRVITVPPVPRAVRASRQWVRQTLTRWRLDEAAEPVEQLVTELVTNSIEHAEDGASVVVLLMYAAGMLRLEVRDHDPLNVPLLRNPGPDDPCGRGLVIVKALSDRWGVRITDTGKSVWCELGTPRPAPARPESAAGGQPQAGEGGHGA